MGLDKMYAFTPLAVFLTVWCYFRTSDSHLRHSSAVLSASGHYVDPCLIAAHILYQDIADITRNVLALKPYFPQDNFCAGLAAVSYQGNTYVVLGPNAFLPSLMKQY